MKCWTFLVLQVLITAAEDTSVAPQQDYCPEPPDERILYRVHEDAVGDDGALAQGSVLRYRCGAGYASSGPISVWNVTCTRSYDGVLHWVLPDHDCRLVTCEPLENLANGFVETEGNEYGSTARYQCERGFRLQGEAERKCGPDGLWTGYAPTCQEVTCPAPEPPEGGTSDISKDAGPQRLGTVVRYSCPLPLMLVGSRSSTCLSVGVWSFDPPKCSPPCEVPKLGNAFIVEEKTLRSGRRTYTEIPPGTQLLDNNNLFLKCEEGYEYNGRSLTRISCLNGHWDPPQPWCKAAPCEVPKLGNTLIVEEKTIRWNRRIYTKVPPGTQPLDKNNLFLKCEEGYEYNGRSLTRISCHNGHWDPPQPWCKAARRIRKKNKQKKPVKEPRRRLDQEARSRGTKLNGQYLQL